MEKIIDQLQRSALKHPHEVAINFEHGRYRYSKVWKRVLLDAERLSGMGIGENDVVAIKDGGSLKVVKESLEGKPQIAPFVTIDPEKFQGVFARLPERNELPREINESQIIEYYNRLM